MALVSGTDAPSPSHRRPSLLLAKQRPVHHGDSGGAPLSLSRLSPRRARVAASRGLPLQQRLDEIHSAESDAGRPARPHHVAAREDGIPLSASPVPRNA